MGFFAGLRSTSGKFGGGGAVFDIRDWFSGGHGRPNPVEKLQMNHLERITASSQICGGRPCIRGLRIRVKDILDLLASGASREEILGDYPYLENDDITATLEYAAQQTDHPVLRVA